MQFRGMMPILPTAITADGAFDEASHGRGVEYALGCGAVAIGHFGMAAELYKIPQAMRRRVAEVVVDAVARRVPVFLGVTSPGVAISCEFAREAEALGADLIMSALPYVDLPDAEGARAYYEALARATTLPIIVQDTPASSATLTAELLVGLTTTIENVQHVKAEGKAVLAKTAALLERTGDDVSVIGGAGGRLLIHLLRLGVTAFMTGTEALELHGGAVAAYLAGDEERAAKIYFEQILPYLEFYLEYPEELLKWMLERRGVLESATVLAPRAAAPMSEVERRELEWVLARIGWGEAR
mgnify:CR=1 FL=1